MDISIKEHEVLLCVGLPIGDNHQITESGLRIADIKQRKRCDRVWCIVAECDNDALATAETLRIPEDRVRRQDEFLPALRRTFCQKRLPGKEKTPVEQIPFALHLLIFDESIDVSALLPHACSVTYEQETNRGDERLPFPEFEDLPCLRRTLAAMARILAQEDPRAALPLVLLTGETGTGKSFAAKLLSRKVSGRDPLTVNCASLDKDNADISLYGTLGGMWTDVKNDVIGAFEAAGDGVLFLDEIGELPLPSQAKLLTVLQEREFRPHGAVLVRDRRNAATSENAPPAPIPVKCRIIFGTNRCLASDVRTGRFREDLYNRINTLELTFPRLDDRFAGRESDGHGQYLARSAAEEKRSALAFMERLREKACRDFGGLRMSPGAIAVYQTVCAERTWPGNFRDINRLFSHLSVLAATENGRHLVGQHMVENAIAAMGLKSRLSAISANQPPRTNTNPPTAIGATNSFPDESIKRAYRGKTALEAHVLTFALKVAAESSSLKEAAARCYAGTSNRTNVSSKYKALLKRYGLAFDATSDGHVRTL